MIPHDWPFVPTKEQLEGLNELRDRHNLPRLKAVTRAREWFNACFEIDDCAENEPELGPCPFCGSVAIFERYDSEEGTFLALCPRCNVSTVQGSKHDTAEVWNRRV